jgi:hypothetical protein
VEFENQLRPIKTSKVWGPGAGLSNASVDISREAQNFRIFGWNFKLKILGSRACRMRARMIIELSGLYICDIG